MKSIVLNIAFATAAISAICTSTHAQVVRTITGNEHMNCIKSEEAPGQTIVDGAWAVITDKTGNLIITDKNNNVIRMVADGGKTIVAEKGLASNAPNYPFSLVVDKCGNLHITDNTVYSGSNAALPTVLPHETNSWSDPDMVVPATTEPVVLASKQN